MLQETTLGVRPWPVPETGHPQPGDSGRILAIERVAASFSVSEIGVVQELLRREVLRVSQGVSFSQRM